MELHEKLKGLREDRDLKLKDIAALLNTSTQYYQKYEKREVPHSSTSPENIMFILPGIS